MSLRILRASDPSFEDAWGMLGGRQWARDALYGPESLAFYREYAGVEEVEDLSFIVADGGEGLIGTRVHVFRNPSGAVEMSCYGLPCLVGERASSAAPAREAARKLARTELLEPFQKRGAARLVFRDGLDDGRLSYLGRALLSEGATASPHLSQMIDLTQPEDKLRAALTKTVRWSINWGMKTLDIRVLDRATIAASDMQAFRELHIEVAGRETRSPKTWDRQFDIVKAGGGFVVLGYLDGALVTAALFLTSPRHCFYGVSASKRELFDKPIGHAVIWSAMLKAKSEGIGLFEMGEQRFPKLSTPPPSDKEIGISFFKRSFGGETEAYLDLLLQPEAAGTMA
jgi:hypothetical protein